MTPDLRFSDGFSMGFEPGVDAASIRKIAHVPEAVIVAGGKDGARVLVMQQGAISVCINLNEAEAKIVANALTTDVWGRE